MKHAALAFLFFLALAVALTWPLASHLPTVLADLGDSALNTFIIDWDCYAIAHAPLHLFDAPIFVPDKFPLAYSENMIGIALLLLPLHGLGAVAVHNLGIIFGFATSALGAYVLARMITRDTIASILAGVFYGFTSFKLDHIVHLQIVWSAWLPLLFAATLAYWRRPDGKRASFVGIAFAMNGLSNIYFLLMGGVAMSVTVALLAIAEPRRERAFWTRLSIALGIAVLILIPVLAPYEIVSRMYGFKHRLGEVTAGSASLRHWLIAAPFDWLYGRPDPQGLASERHLFPGLLVVALLACATFLRRRAQPQPASGAPAPSPVTAAAGGGAPLPVSRHVPRVIDIALLILVTIALAVAVMPPVDLTLYGYRVAFDNAAIPIMLVIILGAIRLALDGSLRRAIAASRFDTEEWAAAVWIGVGFVGSLGMHAFLHRFLFRVVPPFGVIRAPARWAVIAYTGLAVWAAIGASALMNRTRYRRAVGTLLIALAVVEVIPHGIEWHEVPPVAPVYRWLRDARPGVAIELPMSGHGEQALYLLASTAHHQPIMNGASGWDGPTHLKLNAKWTARQLDDDFVATIRQAQCRVIIVHTEHLGDRREEVKDFTRRFAFLRSFGPDVVYSLTR